MIRPESAFCVAWKVIALKVAVACTALLLMSCVQAPVLEKSPIVLEEAVIVEARVPVELIRSTAQSDEELVLDVGVQIFDVSEDKSKAAGIGDWIFDEILDIESQYLPIVLRNSLIESAQWGSVRVLPRQDPSMDLQVIGTILQSDGLALQLNIRAVDGTGREWLNKTYSGVSAKEERQAIRSTSSTDSERSDPFQSLYSQIANDLAQVKLSLSNSELLNIRRVSEIRYATDLSPETFASLLAHNPDGTRRVRRLLAENDPMLDRIARMRIRHHVFIDTVDEYYAATYRESLPIYNLWRFYSRDQIIETQAEEQRGKSVSKKAGDFDIMSNRYHRYQANKMFEQEWAELASGFTGEVAPAILALNKRVYGLTGSVDEQYEQWRAILRQLYLKENTAAGIE